MLFIGIFVIILIFFGSKIQYKPLANSLSTTHSKGIRGAAALVVVIHHIMLEMPEDGGLISFFQRSGFLAVSLFFFYSGYGLMKSHQDKENYAKTFFSRRILAIALPYTVITAIYWLADQAFGIPHDLKGVLLAIYNGTPIVKDSWYIVAILIFYCFFWVLMLLFKQRKGLILAGSAAWLVLWLLFCKRMNYQFYWYNTAPCLCLGLVVAVTEQKLLNAVKRWYPWLLAAAAVLFVVSYLGIVYLPIAGIAQLLLYWVTGALFVMLVLLLTATVRIGNPVLEFLFGISLELYLIHRLVMNFLRSKFLFIENDILWSISVLLLSAGLAFGLHWCFTHMNRGVQKLFGLRKQK
jgi:peptidoglycan/LPS O-acetylase OafA/YrhL